MKDTVRLGAVLIGAVSVLVGIVQMLPIAADWMGDITAGASLSGIGALLIFASTAMDKIRWSQERESVRYSDSEAAVRDMIREINLCERGHIIRQASLSRPFNRGMDGHETVYKEFDSAVARAVDRGVDFRYLVNSADPWRAKRIAENNGKRAFQYKTVADKLESIDLPNFLIFEHKVFIGMHGPEDQRHLVGLWNSDLVRMYQEHFSSLWKAAVEGSPPADPKRRAE